MNDEPSNSPEREARLDEAVAEYLGEVENGWIPNREQLLARYPELANDLADFLDDHAQIQDLVNPVVKALDLPRTACPQLRFAAGGSSDPFPVPHRLGRIELTAVIGRVAFGTVYKGWDTVIRRDVAVKALRTDSFALSVRLEHFLREAQIAGQMNHPGIVRVYDVNESDGVPYLVSEFIPGRTLAELIQGDRPTPKVSALLVARVADTLEYTHQKRVTHRDIKPSNIFVKTDQEPMLTNFGCALWDTGKATVPADEGIVGTLAYMSPEQARGHSHHVDGRSDVYSLGVVLYELLTGERPFSGIIREVLRQIEFDEPRPPRSLDDRIPLDLETICLKCLRKEPVRRYSAAAEVASDLRSFLARKPIRARAVGWRERLILWGRRNPALASAIGLAVVLLVLLVAAVFWVV